MRHDHSPRLVCAATAAALTVAMGIGRFAFTPMLPLMVRDGSLAASASPALAAANYAGYLVGAVMAARLRWPDTAWARWGLLGVVLTTLAMGMVAGPLPWAILRGLAGVFSGWALVGISAWVMRELSAHRRAHWAAFAYTGVGVGIAGAGLFCWIAAPFGVASSALWLLMGAAAAIVAALPLALIRTPSGSPAAAPANPGRTGGVAGLVFCYGLCGFGYILPATFLPLLAQRALDDPRVFGLVWPLFGLASAATILLAGSPWIQSRRLPVWAIAQALMGTGALLPTLWPGIAALAASALLVGSTFMIATVLGMQEARARAPERPVAALGQMTAAFATGQLAGPLLVVFGEAALAPGLRLASLALFVSAAGLLALSRRPAPHVFIASKKS